MAAEAGDLAIWAHEIPPCASGKLDLWWSSFDVR
jgi:hypothetical protein